VDPEKIESIREWSVPNNVIEFRSFMGLAGYYRIFIEGFSMIAHPSLLEVYKRKEEKIINK
jgi:hypothetical protein